MARFKPPRCQAILPNDRPCGHEMKPLGERHPDILNHPGHWAFMCGYCGAGRILDSSKLERYVERA